MPIIIKPRKNKKIFSRNVERDFDNEKIRQHIRPKAVPKRKPFRETVKAYSVKRSPGEIGMSVQNTFDIFDLALPPNKLTSRAKKPTGGKPVVRTAPSKIKMKVPLKLRARPKKRVAKH